MPAEIAPQGLRSLVLWDGSGARPSLGVPVIHWNGYSAAAGDESVFRYCEEHAQRLKSRYCRWIRDLGEHRIHGRRVIDHLRLDEGLSYWWMTRFVEQSPFKSPAISDAIRLLALEEILLRLEPERLIIFASNHLLLQSLRELCDGLTISHEFRKTSAGAAHRISLAERFRSLPYPLRAVATVARHLPGRWALRRADRTGWIQGRASLLICSYFLYLDDESTSRGEYQSRYWGRLQSILASLGLSANWLHLYMPAGSPSASIALQRARLFNENGRGKTFHGFHEAHLSSGILFRALRRWVRLLILSWRLRGIRQGFRPSGSRASLWPLMKSDWLASMRGPDAIWNLLAIDLFDAALRAIPHQPKGLYLCENQAWERAFIRAWRKNGHGELIAVPHSTQSFWDLRYAADPRAFDDSADLPLPLPDQIAVNGPAAMATFLAGSHPPRLLVECEALRYGSLARSPHGPGDCGAESGTLRVLVLGEYLRSGTESMLRLLEAALPRLSRAVRFSIKPHPNCPVDPRAYPSLHLEVTTQPLERILQGFDVAFSSNMTSASVDAFVAGLPVLVSLDGSQLNFNPLRGILGTRFVATPEELAEGLEGIRDSRRPKNAEFFFLDPGFPRWRQLLRVQ